MSKRARAIRYEWPDGKVTYVVAKGVPYYFGCRIISRCITPLRYKPYVREVDVFKPSLWDRLRGTPDRDWAEA